MGLTTRPKRVKTRVRRLAAFIAATAAFGLAVPANATGVSPTSSSTKTSPTSTPTSASSTGSTAPNIATPSSTTTTAPTPTSAPTAPASSAKVSSATQSSAPATSAAASTTAQQTGQPVEVTSLTTETQQVVANPNGTFTATTDTRPVRVKKNGNWLPIDTTLIANADGTLSPKATLTQVVFSAGGTGPAITMTSADGAKSIAVSLPEALPAPQVTGNSALYPDVLPGIDLRLAANSDSYSEVLVVHNATAAANPALATLKMHLHSTGVSVSTGSNDTIVGVDANGTEVFRAPQPVMWDSHLDPHAGPTPNADDPGSGLVTAMPTAVTTTAPLTRSASPANNTVPTSDADLTMSPPAPALTGSGVTYPLFVDPIMGGSSFQQHWDEVDNQGGASWDNNSSNAKVGLCDYSDCVAPWRTMRAYYQMDTSYLDRNPNGLSAAVYAAHFYITQVWNGATGCTATPVDLYSAGTITSGTTWPGPAVSMLDRVSSGAGNGCSAAQLSFNALSWAKNAAAGWWPNTTFALRADTESDDSQWKQFNNSAKLEVTFNYPPNVPSTPTMTGAITCNGINYSSTPTPTFTSSATDNNAPPLNLNLNFQVRDLTNNLFGSGTMRTPSGTPVSWPSNTTLTNVDWQVSVNATNITNDASLPITSVWSNWYQFRVLNEQLSGYQPTVTSYDFPESKAGALQWGAPQGHGQFFIGTGGSPNIVGYQYSYDNNAFNSPPTCGNAPVGVAVAAGSGGKATIVIPPKAGLTYGHHTLYVRGYDMVGQPTGTTPYEFMLAPNYVPEHYPVSGAVTNTSLGKCLDDLNGTLGNLATVDVTDCNGAAAQIWTLRADNSLATGNQANGWWCLDVDNAGTAENTPVHLHQCNGSVAQHWLAESDATGGWHLKNPNSGYCLDDPNASTVNGTAVDIHDCNDSAAQKWSIDLNASRYEGQDAINNVTVTNPASGYSTPQLQGNVGGVSFSGGNQLVWFGAGANSTMTIPFDISTEADYSLGIQLLKSFNYANITFTLDNDTSPLTPANLPGGVYDAYTANCCSSEFVPLGGRHLTHLTQGPHQLKLTVTGKDTLSSGYGIGVDFLQIAPYANATVDSFAHSLNNHGISPDTSTTSANLDLASSPKSTDVGGAGYGASLSADALAKAKLGAGGDAFTVDGINFKTPTANNGYDNTIAMGQSIVLDPSQQIRSNAVGLLVVATDGGVPGSSTSAPQIAATLDYGAGASPQVISNLPAVADWCKGPSASAAYTLAYRNLPSGRDTSCAPNVYLLVLPAIPVNSLQSITLPYYGTDLTAGSHTPALHVLAIGVRPAAGANLTTSADASGNNHRLTLNGHIGFDNAQMGGAAVFDGSGGNASTSSAVVDTTKSFSISAWVYLPAVPTSTETLVTQQASTVGSFSLDAQPNGWDFVRTKTDATNATSETAVSNTPPATQTPTHLVGTWDATTGKMTLYVNGVAQNSTPTDSTPIPSNGPLVIGRGFYNGVTTNFVTGEIADVQAYQRVLDATEVSTLGSNAVTNSLATPAGWWQLEDFGRNWTGVWAAQPDSAAPTSTPSLAGMTIRQVIHPSNLGYGTVNTLINGQYGTQSTGVQTRIRLSNRFGSAPVNVTAASIAAQTTAGGAATGSHTSLTFEAPDGTHQPSVTINPGDEVISDPLQLPDTSSGSGNLVVSLALAANTGTPPVANQLTNPAYPVYLANGNQTADEAGTGTLWSTNSNLTGRYFLSGLDVTDVNDPQTSLPQPGTIAILGDQVSGAGTPTTWTDLLGRDPAIFNPSFDPNNDPGPNPGGFVNLSNSGASVASADAQFTSAPNATVLDEPNLKAVLLTLGLNDLRSGATAATIETNINTLISAVGPYGITNHYNPDGSRKVDVYLATIPDAPGLTVAQESERSSLNKCITSQGANCTVKIQFGGTSNAGAAVGYVDFAAAVAAAGSSPSQTQINTAILNAIKADTGMTSAW